MPEVSGYSRAQIALHWGIVLLLGVSYFSSDAMKSAWIGFHEGRNAFGTVAAAHLWTGIGILVFALARVAIRLNRGAPALPAGGSKVTDAIAKLTHLGLYAILVLIPTSGLVAWFGAVDLAGEAHEVIFNLGVALVVLHVAGAVYHQFVLKDGLMERMKRPG